MFIPYLFQKSTTEPTGLESTKLHFDSVFNNCKVLPRPTKNRVVEQPTKKLVPETDLTQQQQQQPQQQ